MGAYFFTVNLRDRISDLLVPPGSRHFAALFGPRGHGILSTLMRGWCCRDHLNCLWTLPTGDVGFPVRSPG